MRTRICSWTGCARLVPRRDLFCYRHWLKIPPSERFERVRLAMEERQS